MATGNVAANAITAIGGYSDDGSTSIPTSETEVASLTVSTNGGSVIIIAKCQVVVFATTANAGTPQALLWLRKTSVTGSIIDLGEIRFTDDTTEVESVVATLIGLDASPSASQTYKLTAQKGSSNTDGNLQRFRLVAFNLKK